MTTPPRPSAHDVGSPPVAGDPTSFPTHAELVRTLLGVGGFGSLTTMTEGGYPYGSLAAFSVDPDGRPVLCISEMAEHTRNARREPRAGLFVAAPATDSVGDPLDEPRASLIGDLRPFEPADDDVSRHLAVHPQTGGYMHFADFGWWRLSIVSARYVGGFGTMSWVDGAAIATAEIDPVLAHSRAAIDHMNADHADATLDMSRHLADIPDATGATVHAIDRHGVTLYVDTPGGFRMARLRFPGGPLASASDVRAAVVDLTHRARENGDAR